MKALVWKCPQACFRVRQPCCVPFQQAPLESTSGVTEPCGCNVAGSKTLCPSMNSWMPWLSRTASSLSWFMMHQIGLSPPETIHDDAGKSYDLPAMGWRMPCMIAHEGPRTLSVALVDGTRIEFEEKTVTKKITRG